MNTADKWLSVQSYDEPEEKPEKINYIKCVHDKQFYSEHEMINEKQSGDNIHRSNIISYLNAIFLNYEPNEIVEYEVIKIELINAIESGSKLTKADAGRGL